MSRIYLDSNIFIYLLESHPTWGERAREAVAAMQARSDLLMTSALTIGEVLTKPIFAGDQPLIDAYESMFHQPSLEVVAFDTNVARTFAQVRAKTAAKPADAIHLASAASRGCDLFVTHDSRLTKLIVPGIHFIATLENAPL